MQASAYSVFQYRAASSHIIREQLLSLQQRGVQVHPNHRKPPSTCFYSIAY